MEAAESESTTGRCGRPQTAPNKNLGDMSTGPTKPRRLSVTFRLICSGLSLLWITAIIVRFSIRDRLPVMSVLFYATPPAVLVVLALSISILLILQKRSRLAIIGLLFAATCGIYWWQTSFFQNPAGSKATTVNVFFWNCQRGIHGWNNVAKQIHEADAPLIGLVEAVSHTKKLKRRWRSEFFDYDVATPGGQIVMITKGTILRSQLVPLGNDSRCGEFEVELDGRQLAVLVVDIRSNPFLSRRDAFEKLLSLIEAYGDQPLLIMGDFNTPTDSYLFDRLRGSCQNAFETAGYGNSATWPLPLPVLPLDQVWTNPSLRAMRCRHMWTTNSDHRPVVTDISFLPALSP